MSTHPREAQARPQSAVNSLVLGIAGVGLIGGSIAAAARSRGIASRIIGFGRSEQRLAMARARGLIDAFSTDYAACADVELFICCLPVDRIVDSVREASIHMPVESIATDAGSTKAAICEELGSLVAPGVAFVGSHPLAGSEQQGFEHADANLFAGRLCVLTPSGLEPDGVVERLAAFWEGLGCRTVSQSPEEHDKILARTSHVPHVAAAAVARLAQSDDLPFAAGGFRDTTRIAAGDPDLWTSIFEANRQAIGLELSRVIQSCEAFREALEQEDYETIRRLLAEAKEVRDQFDRLP